MTNPWMFPLAMSSATVIGLRSWLLWPADGRHTDWQRREAARMVGEKLEAVRESQAGAMALAWRLWFMPWTVWGPLSGRGLSSAMASATGALVEPFSRRAAGNATRLQARAVREAVQALPAMAALPGLAVASTRRSPTRGGAIGRSRPRRRAR